MHVYFVRHGETDLNAQSVHQAPSTPLNARGYDQARTVGELLRPADPTLLITSTHVRAEETARVIGQSLGITPVRAYLFREVEWPSNLIGKSLISFGSVRFLIMLALFRNRLSWRYRDGENIYDLYTRIQKAFSYIDSLVEAHNSVVIVSHSEYIRLMIRYMCHGQKLTLREIITTLLSVRKLKNGEVVHVEYIGPTVKGTCPWLLRE
jgi:broad specificity phosphatase PhoE